MAPTGNSLFPRDANNGGLSPIYIAGIAVVCAIILGVIIWLGIHAYNKHRKGPGAKATSRTNVYLPRNGTIDDKDPFASQSSKSSAFSRKDLSGIIMPEPLKTKEDILSYHRQNGTLTHAFKLSVSSSQGSTSTPNTPARTHATPSPLNSSLSPPAASYNPRTRSVAPGLGSRPGSSLNPDNTRGGSRSSFNPAFVLAAPGERPISTISWTPPSPVGSSFSFTHSRDTSGSSITSFFPAGGAAERTVRQVFAPVLPDELVIAVGERLTVVQNMDDGWCVAGRANANPAAVPNGAFGQRGGDEGVEMGVVPAWVFVKPVKGLRAERPMRTTSLGVTVEVPAPLGAREKVMSWSNF
ncbi:hypothetical protein K488DRAFT_71591 [Vararia minispora EC-137]|uniref:Uncharacterized protein n=1 Tax=Vararia minispora EC-137 TaxID=1314806 RepID=A0ACB8QH82_9AGAM|nr:hypothetical protein K488DRAFT_71591 [Vararia minispora EC-137]